MCLCGQDGGAKQEIVPQGHGFRAGGGALLALKSSLNLDCVSRRAAYELKSSCADRSSLRIPARAIARNAE